MVSMASLNELPNIEDLEQLCMSLAMLDAIMSPEWEYRYFSFNSKWADGERLASMRNGLGDEYFVWFSDPGVIIKGFDHESEMSPYANEKLSLWPGVLDQVPSEFQEFLGDPSMPPEYTTFCTWRLCSDSEWHIGQIGYPNSDPAADGSEWLLFALDENPATYTEFASEYYETNVDPDVVRSIYEQTPLSDAIVKKLNSELKITDLLGDIDEIGYPVLR
jgi:hypothetical protein